MVKVDYNTDIYSKIVTDTDDKIIGWLDDDENPVAYDFDGKRIGRAIVEYEAKDKYKNKVYSSIKENSNGLYEPAKDSKEIGKVTGNITRVMFKKVNDDFKLHLALIAEMMKYDTYDDYHDANDEKNSSVYQYKKGMNEFFDSHINNQQLGLDSGSIEAAKGQFWGSIDNCEDAESVTNLLKNAIKQNNMLTGENVELDKDGNIEVHKINMLLLNYYVLIVNISILLAITVIAVVANKKKKGNDPTNIGPTAFSATGPAGGSEDPVTGPTGPTAFSATGPAGGSEDPVTGPTGPAGGSEDPATISIGQTASAGQTNIGSLLDEFNPNSPTDSLSNAVLGIESHQNYGLNIDENIQFIFNSAFSSIVNSIY